MTQLSFEKSVKILKKMKSWTIKFRNNGIISNSHSTRNFKREKKILEIFRKKKSKFSNICFNSTDYTIETVDEKLKYKYVTEIYTFTFLTLSFSVLVEFFLVENTKNLNWQGVSYCNSIRRKCGKWTSPTPSGASPTPSEDVRFRVSSIFSLLRITLRPRFPQRNV